MPQLISPTTDLHGAWLDAHAEWGPGQHEDGFGLAPEDEVRSPAGFAAWVARLDGESDKTAYWWIVEDGRVLGGVALRHKETDYVRWAGHIGFGVCPSARRRGLASWALNLVLAEARARGVTQVLIVCATDNTASARTIERAGGVFEEVRDTEHGPVRRYRLCSREET
ncbi:GNAT family N-acetyltransferase [Allokutzneria sp. NRRL B-24872]|uniref:GNAT family N-acetyltransferase n=1 Tax=Allokutzneria sp. NRRL B-24872 TaxID=1137961 RepID=UPI000A3AF240|nr:GNAT family N-acetyltransferase [Allokutzneria sp. NRRL B-24872]